MSCVESLGSKLGVADFIRRIADYYDVGIDTVGIVSGTASDPLGTRLLTALA